MDGFRVLRHRIKGTHHVVSEMDWAIAAGFQGAERVFEPVLSTATKSAAIAAAERRNRLLFRPRRIVFSAAITVAEFRASRRK